jgi:transposase InsO family protein
MIERVHRENFGVYGAAKVWAQLNREDQHVARYTVERLKRDLGLRGAVRGKPVRTTFAADAGDRPRDLVDRKFTAPAPNRLGTVALSDRGARRAGVASFCGQIASASSSKAAATRRHWWRASTPSS